MQFAEFTDAIRDLVDLDLHTGETSPNSDHTYLLSRGPADFAEQVVLLIDQHNVRELEFASDSHIQAARARHESDQVQIDDNAIVSHCEATDDIWVSAWVRVSASTDV